jgi:dTDP-D-glucose 4,6-dehydratase
VLGTHTLLECARASKKIKLFIHVSTDEVYGDVFGEGAVENAILEPTNPYSCSKAAAEFICKVPCHAMPCRNLLCRQTRVSGTACSFSI